MKIGKIKYDRIFLQDNQEILQKLYAKIIPLEIKYEDRTYWIEVTALSEHFDEMSTGEVIPTYQVLITTQHRKDGNIAHYFKFKREH
jgi:hypothetical protein